MTITAPATGHKKHLIAYLIGSGLVLAGAAGPLPGCSSLGITARDAATAVSIADAVVRTVARESDRVKEARERCKALEERACSVGTKEEAAAVLRALSEAQRDLADALDSNDHVDGGAPPPDAR